VTSVVKLVTKPDIQASSHMVIEQPTLIAGKTTVQATTKTAPTVNIGKKNAVMPKPLNEKDAKTSIKKPTSIKVEKKEVKSLAKA
jgi:hypothetical protein